MFEVLPIYLNTALVISCLVFAIIFLVIPLPAGHRGLKNYKISLRTLAVAYLLVPTLLSFSIIIGEPEVALLSIINLNIASFQAILFPMALIVLLNPHLVTKRFLVRLISPILLFDLVSFSLSLKWNNPDIADITELISLWSYPTVVVRELFLLFFVVQLVYMAVLFVRQTKHYERALSDYFADGYKLQLHWVVVCFYSALALGVFGVFMMCFFSIVWELVFTACCLVFYVVFGVCYIQYPRTFLKVEPAIQPVKQAETPFKVNHKIAWSGLRAKIVKDKYYTRIGVNIEDMAQYLNVGRTTLSGFINKEEGVNFNVWVGTLRVEEAIRIFNEFPHYSIAQVSEMVGYSEPSNFSRQFKNIIGQAPSEWCQHKRHLA